MTPRRVAWEEPAQAHKYQFEYVGLPRCGAVTAEQKKGKYTYYRCTGYHGKCALPDFREEELGDRLAVVLKNIHIPDEILDSFVHSGQPAT